MNPDQPLFQARIYHGLKGLLSPGDTLPPRFLEFAICEAFDLDHVGDGNFYADGIKDDIQVSIKTRMLNPHVLKRKQGRDFQSNPEMFLGPQQNVKQNKWTFGLEIVQRRQAVDFDDIKAEAQTIGLATLEGFKQNVEESYKKYNTKQSQEVIGVHGYDYTGKFYLINLFWKEYQHINPDKIEWRKEGYGVAGYFKSNGISFKVAERINGNSKREATCFKEYKNLLQYKKAIKFRIPMPKPWEFDKAKILEEIGQL